MSTPPSPADRLPDFETIVFEIGSDGVATITLDRPDALNAFDRRMVAEFEAVWAEARRNRDIRAIVLQAAGERAFCTGVDVKTWREDPEDPFHQMDPGASLSPKTNKVWKPLICAVRGMAAGGAFYWLNEADLIVCSEDATFFDPHVTYGMTAALEPIGMTRRIPLGEVLRIALVGLDERVSAQRAYEIGLVNEVVAADRVRARAHELAAAMAAKPAAAIQGTVRAIWESLDVGRTAALEHGLAYTQLGNPLGMAEVDRETQQRPKPIVR